MSSEVQHCPICGGKPVVGPCDIPGTGWHAGCYRIDPYEHHLGVNRGTEAAAIEAWNYVARATAVPAPAIVIPFPGQSG